MGGKITVTGINFGKRESVSLTLDSSKRLKTVKTNRAGSFRTTVKLPPKSSCDHTIVAKGKKSKRTASTAITIGTCGAAAISVNDTTPRRGGKLTVTGVNFGAKERVTIYLHSALKRLETVRTNSAGTFSTTVKLPRRATCDHSVVAKGRSSGRSASTPVRIGKCRNSFGLTAAVRPASVPGGDAIALIGIGVLGLALLGGGSLLKTAKRRKVNS